MLAAWREQAWRNAEALADAPTPEARAVVAQAIETNAATEANLIVLQNSYVPPVTSSASRDSYCAVENATAPPLPYAFGTASTY